MANSIGCIPNGGASKEASERLHAVRVWILWARLAAYTRGTPARWEMAVGRNDAYAKCQSRRAAEIDRTEFTWLAFVPVVAAWM